jgi:dynein heavy chain
MNFSAQTTSEEVQRTIEAKLEKKRKRSIGAKGNSRCFIFIDDINMPAYQEYGAFSNLNRIWLLGFGAQPPIELLRQLIAEGGFYDRPNFFWKTVEKFNVVAAAAPPGGGR